jgi:hypothetical protein
MRQLMRRQGSSCLPALAETAGLVAFDRLLLRVSRRLLPPPVRARR